MNRENEVNLIAGAEIVRAILAREKGDIEAVMEDLLYAEVANKRYLRMRVEIDELRRQDIELHSFIEDRYDIGPMDWEFPPILVGKRQTHGPYIEGLVIDGFYRVAMAFTSGRKTIEAYALESVRYIRKSWEKQ